ncbi:MAG TPA: multicopper oxidase domain-containing protein [Acidimicrobiales bacterium]|nr:multicopper oxidase domain-containing protein [Acidimicrobiales bacterium]
MTAHLSRRQLLGLGLGTAAAGAAGWSTPSAAAGRKASPSRTRLVELPQPVVRSSVGNVLSVPLEAKRGVVNMRAPQMVHTYTFDGIVPGYTWELAAGDQLQVDLTNHLAPVAPPNPMRMDRPHEWTNTNLHTHGLHVSPSGISDNIFLDIPSGETQHYEIDIPPDHPGGLFWYHPHRHGAVTQQVRAGMAGALIVRGAIDQVPEVSAAQEKVMVMQSIELGDDFQLLDPIPDPTKTQAFFPRTKVLYTVNGVLNPKVTMYPGEVQRWRILNAAEGKYLSLRLDKHPFHTLAWDGLTLGAPDVVEDLMLSAGNRVEVLVKAGQPGTYALTLTPGSSQKPNIPGMPESASAHDAIKVTDLATMGPGAMASMIPAANMPDMNPIPGELEVRSILTVEVVGSGPDMALPATLPAFDPPMPAIARKRQFAFTVQRDSSNEFISFGVDGIPFDPNRPPYQVPLGTVEEWTLVNAHDPKLMDHAHVFHIHVNSFKLTKINGRPVPTPMWRDTFVLTKKTGDSLTFEMNFTDYRGKFVEHCHVLGHEDLGMMSAIEVV